MPEIGENVHVWPHPGRNVRSHAELNRMLPEEGMKLPWSAWLEELLGQGMVHLTDPKAQVTADKAKELIAAAVAAEEAATKAAPEAKAEPVPAAAEPVAEPVATPAPTTNEGK